MNLNMNRKIAAMIFALPVGVVPLLAGSASAAEVNLSQASQPSVLVAQQYDGRRDYPSRDLRNDRSQEEARREALRRDEPRREALRRQDTRRDVSNRVWVPGHWEPGFLGIGRKWVEGHWAQR